jgi:hypothetical protein
MNYYVKSKAHKEFIKKHNRLHKLNLKEYHNTKEFNKKTNSAINSKIKQQLDQCSFIKCPELYKK